MTISSKPTSSGLIPPWNPGGLRPSHEPLRHLFSIIKPLTGKALRLK